MRYLTLALCFIFKLSAQDTIFTKAPNPLLVRVLEISKSETSYKVFYNPDGVIYKLDNSQIIKIVYENGKTESRFQLTQKTVGIVNANENKFIIEDKHISINGKDITHSQALKTMLKRDATYNSENLNGALISAESCKNKQLGFTLLSPVCFVGGFYFGYRYQKYNYTGKNTLQTSKTILFSGIGLSVVCVATSLIYKSLKNKNIRKAALLYNNDL